MIALPQDATLSGWPSREPAAGCSETRWRGQASWRARARATVRGAARGGRARSRQLPTESPARACSCEGPRAPDLGSQECRGILTNREMCLSLGCAVLVLLAGTPHPHSSPVRPAGTDLRRAGDPR